MRKNRFKIERRKSVFFVFDDNDYSFFVTVSFIISDEKNLCDVKSISEACLEELIDSISCKNAFMAANRLLFLSTILNEEHDDKTHNLIKEFLAENGEDLDEFMTLIEAVEVSYPDDIEGQIETIKSLSNKYHSYETDSALIRQICTYIELECDYMLSKTESALYKLGIAYLKENK